MLQPHVEKLLSELHVSPFQWLACVAAGWVGGEWWQIWCLLTGTAGPGRSWPLNITPVDVSGPAKHSAEAGEALSLSPLQVHSL